jgi:hypothetical protein
MRLRTEIKRIKGGQTYPSGYERDRAREIKSADTLRLLGKPIPTYLEGVDPPWIGMGKANMHYDDNEVSKREAKIEKIKRLNAEHCQQEHIHCQYAVDSTQRWAWGSSSKLGTTANVSFSIFDKSLSIN